MKDDQINRTKNFAGWVRTWGYPIIVHPARILGNMGITPNILTVTSFMLNILATLVFILGQWPIAGCTILIGGILDILDGVVARETNQESKFGSFLDSVLDQYGEVAILIGFMLNYLSSYKLMESVLIFACSVGILLTSYVRSRSSELGIECRVGLVTHFERIILFGLGMITRQITIVLWLVAIFSNLTAIQRIVYTWRIVHNESSLGSPKKP